MLSTSPAVAGTAKPEIKTTRHRDGATVVVQAGALTVTQTLTRAAVDLRLALDEDTVQFSADLEGRVLIRRQGAHRAFSVRSATHEDQATLNATLAGSPALAMFDALLRSEWARSSEVATLLQSTREVLRVVQGDYQSIDSLLAASSTPARVSLIAARQRMSPSQCWETYNRDVVYFTYQLQWCLGSVSSQWWNPLATAWCAYEYNLKSSLAAVWLLDCYGVPV
jgi:hypothetical protein